jgi:hypothetical protein
MLPHRPPNESLVSDGVYINANYWPSKLLFVVLTGPGRPRPPVTFVPAIPAANIDLRFTAFLAAICAESAVFNGSGGG